MIGTQHPRTAIGKCALHRGAVRVVARAPADSGSKRKGWLGAGVVNLDFETKDTQLLQPSLPFLDDSERRHTVVPGLVVMGEGTGLKFDVGSDRVDQGSNIFGLELLK